MPAAKGSARTPLGPIIQLYSQQDPGVTGRGRARLKRWTFTKAAGCYEFDWGGKPTNQNKFKNKEDCERKCNNKGRKGRVGFQWFPKSGQTPY